MRRNLIQVLESKIEGEILSDKELRDYYSVDASSYQIIPKAVVIANNQKDIINTIKAARKFNTTVTVRGAGTGLVGSALNSGIILDLKKLNKIKIRKNYAVVEPGVVKGILDKKLQSENKFFPPNPSIGSFCSIGGMLGNNSSGSRSLKYGSVIDNVLEVTIADGNGRLIKLPENKNISKKISNISKKISKKSFPNVSKNSSGYRIDTIKNEKDAHKIILGSEGTLGIILLAKIKIQNIPKNKALVVIEYDSNLQAAKNCKEILTTHPSAMEFVDKPTLKHIPEKFNKKTNCLLFIEYDEKISTNLKNVRILSNGKIKKIIHKDNEIFKWWKYRDSSLHYSLKSIKKENRIPHIIEDSAVPIEKIEKVFSVVKQVNKKFGTKSIIYGHIGNGNLHIRLSGKIVKKSTIKAISKEFFSEIIRQSGTITAEHGDGIARSEFIKKQYGKKNYEIFQELKRLLDQDNILNPNKIVSSKIKKVN
ncbi:FAD-binding oxidoreductase [Nitrosopumilus sp.]|uniref:FAD-binding oxidoreductase n=1 Tax=Nitrosopumilus sp. TaxID=2024843 RepID=UPI0026029B1F|nr:FAD-binding oxidoreductase [Nitrosopumilus sp.]